MAKFTTNITMQTDKETFIASKTGEIKEIFRISQEVDASDGLILLLQNAVDIGQNTFRSAKGLIIKNSGTVGAEVQIVQDGWIDGGGSAEDTPTTATASDTNTGGQHMTYLLGVGDFIYIPNFRQFSTTTAKSGANAKLLDNLAPDSNMYVDSTANVDHATSADFGSDAAETTLYLEPYTSNVNCAANLFKVGDLIRIGNEILEVTAIGSKAALATNYLTVKRGMYGSTAATAADTTAVSLAFFNTYADFDKYSTAQTDGSGRFGATNFFSYGRNLTLVGDGIVAGSVAGKFYKAGYQELGMSGITSSTESGLAASTAYAFDIAVDGGSDTTLSFTTSSNTKFGGSDGILQKIQDAMDVQFYTTSSNMLDKRVTVGIVNGDVRFTSGQRLSTSAISITAPASGTTPFGVGRFSMAVGAIEQAVTALLPEDLVYDKQTNIPTSNSAEMFYDDGFGNISGTCKGTINYETGAINLTGCPPNAHFVVTASYESGHSGGDEYTTARGNAVQVIQGRSVNHKVNTYIELIGVR